MSLSVCVSVLLWELMIDVVCIWVFVCVCVDVFVCAR